MNQRAAEFLAALKNGARDVESMQVRLDAATLQLVEKWRQGKQSVKAVVAELIAIADTTLDQQANEEAQ